MGHYFMVLKASKATYTGFSVHEQKFRPIPMSPYFYLIFIYTLWIFSSIWKYPAPHLRSCRFIAVVRARLKVPAKNPTALHFLSRGKQEERKTTTTIQCFFMEWVKWDMLSAHICSQREKWHAKVQICYGQKLFSNNTIVFETFAFHHLPKLPLISCCL